MDHGAYRSLAAAVRARVDNGAPVPLLVAVAGSVCVGKSTTCERLRELLDPLTVEVVTTDGFLFPNAELEARGIAAEKGFPRSYDTAALNDFLERLRNGSAGVMVPVYSHERYDVVPDEPRVLDAAAIVIIEGVNALHFRDRVDLGVYIDAPEWAIRQWYSDRLVQMFAAAPAGSFYASLGLDEAGQREFADQVWSMINHVNLVEHIAPTRTAADVVLEKGPDHEVMQVEFRTSIG